ncbi:hypothetical protein CLU79DRAFT_840802 [Phycomyces nitens]|nr:hypothetical protein CLU79DRAFT_840802 [Phycomyces nitens]
MLINTSKPPRIFSLPFEILLLIVSSFSEHDMANFGMTCHNFRQFSLEQEVWKAMYETRFVRKQDIPREDTPDFSWKDTYLERAILRISAVDDMTISYMNSEYWETVPTDESSYGHIAKLNAVCWFLMLGRLDAVPPGSYRVQWRMRVHNGTGWYLNFNFRATLEEINDIHTISEGTYNMTDGFYGDPSILNRGWIVVTIPGTLVIDEKLGFSTVNFSHDDVSTTWKHALEFDWCRLVPVSNTTRYDDSKIYVQYDNDNRMITVKDDSILGEEYYSDPNEMEVVCAYE